MAGLLAVASQAGIAVIEDAAQAHGAEWHGQPGRVVRRSGLLQLLSGEEPGRLRRRGCRRHLAAGTGRSHTGTGQPRPVRWRLTLRPRLRGHQQPPGRPPGDLALRQAGPPRGVERAADRAGRPISRPAQPGRTGRRRPEIDRCFAAGPPRLSPVRRARRPARHGPGRTGPAGHRDRRALPGAVPPAAAAAAVRQAPACRWPSRRPTSCCRCRCSRT